MTWTNKQIQRHIEVCGVLNRIKDNAFEYISNHPECTESDVQEHILVLYKENGLKTAIGKPIVAFGSSAAFPHYDPSETKKAKKIKKGNVVKIDVWARYKGSREPFGDITWMGFVGSKPSKEAQDSFDVVVNARDASVNFLRRELKKKRLPTGYEVDYVAMKILLDAGYKYRKEILHTTGHSIGTTSPHGRYGAVSIRNKKPLRKNLGYTIEPGVYMKGRFGIRSEIDFYIDSKYGLHITTPVQKKFVLL